MMTPSSSTPTRQELKAQKRIAKQQTKYQKDLEKVQVKHFVRQNHLKDVFIHPVAGENAWERAKTRMAIFAHKEKITKYVMAAGFGGGAATVIFVGVGIIKAGGLMAFLASPVGHGAAIGLGVGVVLVVGFLAIKMIRNWSRRKINKRLCEEEKNIQEQKQKQGNVQSPVQSSYPMFQQMPSSPTEYGSNNPFTKWVQTPPAQG